jgi:hypothetical protein
LAKRLALPSALTLALGKDTITVALANMTTSFLPRVDSTLGKELFAVKTFGE